MAQLRAQNDGPKVLAVADDRGGPLLERFRQLLRPRAPREWKVAWRLARDTGTAALPVLERVWREEANPAGQYAALVAIAEAGGADSDTLLLKRLSKTPSTREQLLVLVCLALGPKRESSNAEPIADLLQSSTVKPVIRVAACLAARNYALSPAESWYAEDEPGLAAAVRYCRARVDDAVLERWLQRRSRPHQDLLLRGALLGVRSSADLAPGLEDRARKLLADGKPQAVAFCAAVCATRAIPVGELDPQKNPPHGRLASVLAADPGYRAALMDALGGLFGSSRAETVVRARAGVAMAMQADPDQVKAWIGKLRPADRDVNNPFCFALARRLYRRPREIEQLLDVTLPECDAAAFVTLALGKPIGEVAIGDVILARALRFASAGRLPPAAAQKVMEDTLWRYGWHLGRSDRDARADLVRDLLLAGSEFGRAVGGVEPGEDVYFPRGLTAGDSVYEVAMSYFDFIKTSAHRVPAEYRLR